jgi:RNA polymerase sigma-70 factor (ECF subfamily)
VGVSDADIRPGLLTGDSRAFEALVHRYHGRVYRLLQVETGSPEDAADLTQETFLVVWQDVRRAARAEQIGAWLCGLALRHARSLRRRLFRRARLAPTVPLQEADECSEGDGVSRAAEQAELLSAVRALPPKYRHPLLLFALCGLSHREVAEALGCTEATARWRVSEARARLRRQLGIQEERTDAAPTTAGK